MPLTSLSSDIRFKSIADVQGVRKLTNISGAKLISIQIGSDEASGFVARNNTIAELKKCFSVIDRRSVSIRVNTFR